MRCISTLLNCFFLLFSLMLWSCASGDGSQQADEQFEQEDEQFAQDQEDDYDQEEDVAEGGEVDEEGMEEYQDANDLSNQTMEEEGAGEYDDANLDTANELGEGLGGLEQGNQALTDDTLGNDLQGSYDGNLNPLATEVASVPSMGDAPADSSDRVVRFVTADGTPVYDRPDAGASSLSTLYQGDPLVVSIQGEWAEITSGRYVMTSSLSEKMIPRPQGESPWNPPAGPQP
ncbi:MAG: hypothetical protein AB8G05_16205 [Oligoflexales bacterium]